MFVLLAVLCVIAIVEYAIRQSDPTGTWEYTGETPGHYVSAQLNVPPDSAALFMFEQSPTPLKARAPSAGPMGTPVLLEMRRTGIGLGLAFYKTTPAGVTDNTVYAVGRVGPFGRVMHMHVVDPSLDLALSPVVLTGSAPAPPKAPTSSMRGKAGH